jgi:hypothetical protein
MEACQTPRKSGLTPVLPLPHTERVSSFDIFKKYMDKNKELK